MMNMNSWTHLFYGMVSRMSSGNGTETAKKRTEAHWEEGPGEPEEELKQLLVDIRTRVYLLKDMVQEQSREIEADLDEIPRAARAKESEND